MEREFWSSEQQKSARHGFNPQITEQKTNIKVF